VGIVVSTQSIASVLAQGPAGWLVDWSQRKKWLIAGGAAVVAIGCFGIIDSPNAFTEILTQVLLGVAAALFPPASRPFLLESWATGTFRGESGEMKDLTTQAM
jgi:MFS family permease